MHLYRRPWFIAAILQLNADGKTVDPAPALPAGLTGVPGGVRQGHQLANRAVACEIEVGGYLQRGVPE